MNGKRKANERQENMKKNIHTAHQALRSTRLAMVPVSIDDAADLYAYAKNPDVGPHAGWKPHESIEESRQIIEGLFLPSTAWGIHEIEGNGLPGPMIGTIALEVDRFRPDTKSKEIGYSLAKDAWGRGYMTEAATEVIRYAFEDLGMEILTICTSPVNKRSQRVAEKNGFTYEGRIRKAYRIYTGELRDSLVFSLTKEEWEKNPKPEVAK